MKINERHIWLWIRNSALKTTTKKQYLAQLNLFMNTYSELNRQTLHEFLLHGQGQKRVYHRKYALKSFLEYALNRGWVLQKNYDILQITLKSVIYKIKQRKNIETILLDELEHLISNLKDKELKIILMIEFDTASRIRAILKLREKDIRKFQGKKALYMREKKEKTPLKIITDQTYKYLKTMLKGTPNRYIFLDSLRATSVDLDELYYDLWVRLRRESRNILGKEISFHWIRRGAGIYWYNKTGKDIVFVQELLGHESPETTTKYLKLEGEKVRELMKKEKRNW